MQPKISNHKLIIQIDDKTTELLFESKKIVANEEFVYFNLNKSIKFLLYNDISITYINTSKNFHNIFKFKIQLSDSNPIVINKIKYNELKYISLPPIEKDTLTEPSSRLYCRYIDHSVNNIHFIICSPVIIRK